MKWLLCFSATIAMFLGCSDDSDEVVVHPEAPGMEIPTLIPDRDMSLCKEKVLALVKEYERSDLTGEQRKGVLDNLGNLTSRELEALYGIVEGDDKKRAATAALLCGTIRDAGSFDVLCRAASDKDDWVRHYALIALGMLQNPGAFELLVEKLKNDEVGFVRENAASGLCVLNDRRAILPLIQALKDDEEGVREFALDGLRQYTKVDFGLDYDKWYSWYKKSTK